MTDYTNAELVQMWPRVPDSTCAACGFRGVCTWVADRAMRLCDGCLELLYGPRIGGQP